MTLTSVEIDGLAAPSHVLPASAEELAAALKDADIAGQAVAPMGGGTQLDLGMPPTRLDVVLETTALNHIVEYEPADLTVTVEAGIRFAELQRVLGEHSQFLALDPPAQDGATVGGLIATNASGPLRFSSGTARDLVIGTRVANPDGTLTRAGGRVVKNVAGYDLNKLYIGSLGTLGIIVEMSFKVAPIPPATATIVGQLADLGAVQSVVRSVVRSPLSPLAIEVLAPNQVIFRVGGYAEAVARQERDLSTLLVERGGQRVAVPDNFWQDLAQSRIEAQKRRVVIKASAPLSESTHLVEILQRRLEMATIWAHAGNGVAFAACDSASASALLELRREVCALGDNASMVIQRCPTELKHDIDVWGDIGSSLALMRALKTKLDPRRTLNPGRYVGNI